MCMSSLFLTSNIARIVEVESIFCALLIVQVRAPRGCDAREERNCRRQAGKAGKAPTRAL